MTPPLYAVHCGPAPAHIRLTPGLRRPARLASSGCRPERRPEIPEIPEILKSVLKCPEIH